MKIYNGNLTELMMGIQDNTTQPIMGIEDIQWEYNTTHDGNRRNATQHMMEYNTTHDGNRC